MKIISVFGASNSGKGTVATMLCMLDDRLHHSKFARPMKRQLEDEYCLSEGLLEHRLMKAQPSGYKQQSYLDIMVSLYHERQHLTELPKSTITLLSQCHQYGLTPVFDDCRNDREAALLAQHDVYGLWVESSRGQMLSSDAHQWGIYENLSTRNWVTNAGTLANLMEQVETLYHRSIKRWLDS